MKTLFKNIEFGKKINRVTPFGFVCFVLLVVLLAINLGSLLTTGKHMEGLFYPILITLIIGVLNLKI